MSNFFCLDRLENVVRKRAAQTAGKTSDDENESCKKTTVKYRHQIAKKKESGAMGNSIDSGKRFLSSQLIIYHQQKTRKLTQMREESRLIGAT